MRTPLISPFLRKLHFFANFSLISQYRTTKLGVAWIAISTSILVIVKVMVFVGFSDQSDFSLFLVSGFLAFVMIRYAVLEGAKLILGSESYLMGGILSLRFVIASFPLRVVLFAFYMSWPLFIWMLIFDHLSLHGVLGFIYFMLMIVMLAYCSAVILGFISIIYRDLPHLLSSMFSVIFFLTPILWRPDSREDLGLIYQLNPVAWFIDVFRSPLLGETYYSNIYYILLGVSILFVLSLIIDKEYKKIILMRL